MKGRSLTWILILVFINSCALFHPKFFNESCFQELKTVESIDPQSNDYKDLAFLKDVLKDKRIVWLGETYHTCGSTDSAQIRIIKYLMKNLGYEVLALEHGIHPMYSTFNKLKNNKDLPLHRYDNPFPHYATIPEKYLMKFMNKRIFYNKSKFIGYDFYLTEIFNDTNEIELNKYLKKFFSNNKKIDSIWSNYKRNFKKFHDDGDGSNKIFDYTEKLLTYIDSSFKFGKSKTGKLWKQIIQSNIIRVKAYEKSKQNGMEIFYEMRDSMMAENLKFFLDEYYPQKKFIISSSVFHMVKNYGKIIRNNLIINNSVGHILHQKYDQEIYSIAFLFNKGTIGSNVNGYEKIKPASSYTLQGKLSTSNFNYAFLDFNSMPDSCWLKNEYKLRFLDNGPVKANWSNIFNGIFFIDQEYPKIVDTSLIKY